MTISVIFIVLSEAERVSSGSGAFYVGILLGLFGFVIFYRSSKFGDMLQGKYYTMFYLILCIVFAITGSVMASEAQHRESNQIEK